MIHHARGADHYAHDPRLTCGTRPGCEMPKLISGDDGKCDWCRVADAHWDQVRESIRVARERRDGSYSRMVLTQVIGGSDEIADSLGWGSA